jgi:tetratricopeptide (TPR) repeat protein
MEHKNRAIIVYIVLIVLLHISSGCKVPFKGSGEDIYNETYLYDQYGKQSAAIKHWKKAVSSNPDSVKAHYNLGNSYLKVGKYKLAEEEYKKVLELDPKHVESSIKLGNIDFYKGNYQTALKKWKDSPLLDPKKAEAIEFSPKGNIGLLYAKTRKHELTDARWKKALGLAKEDAKELEVWGWLGKAYYNKKMYKKAIEEWNKVIKIAPGSFAAVQAKANIEVAEKDLAKQSSK